MLHVCMFSYSTHQFLGSHHSLMYRVRINYRRILQNHIFTNMNRNTWCYYHLKEEYLQFHSDLKWIRCAPLVWHGRCPDDTPIPAKPSQVCLVCRSRLRCWCALAILVLSLEVAGRKQCPWRNHTGRNHTLSGLVTGVDRCRRCCLCPLHDQPIDLARVHLGHYETANIPLSNGSNMMYFCSVFVKIWFRKILR